MCDMGWQQQVIEGLRPLQCGQCETDALVDLTVEVACNCCGEVLHRVTVPSPHACVPEEYEGKREECVRLVTSTKGY